MLLVTTKTFPFLWPLIPKANPLKLQIEKFPKWGWCITYLHNEWHKTWNTLIIGKSDKGSQVVNWSLNDNNGV
jgi:hypothetical protein